MTLYTFRLFGTLSFLMHGSSPKMKFPKKIFEFKIIFFLKTSMAEVFQEVLKKVRLIIMVTHA